jgi:hypothetical protein
MSHLRAEPVNIEVDCARIHAGMGQLVRNSDKFEAWFSPILPRTNPLKTPARKAWHAVCISRSPSVFTKVNLRLTSSVTYEVASVEDEVASVGGRVFARWQHVETGESVS